MDGRHDSWDRGRRHARYGDAEPLRRRPRALHGPTAALACGAWTTPLLPHVSWALILSLPPDPAGPRGYVQFAHWGRDGQSDGLRAEAAGGDNLPDTRRLTPIQEERLEALAWLRPGADEKVWNFYREWTAPAPVAEVADLAVRTLREIYGVIDPSELRYRYASFDGEAVDDLALGLEPDERPPRPSSKPPARPATVALTPVVEDGLRRWLGVATLERDADGDYPIPVGSALVFVRVVEGTLPLVAVFSSVLTDVAETPTLFDALNDVNVRIRFARAFWVHRTIVVATELAAVDVTADQIAFACTQLGALADHLDDVLHGRFGGGFAFDGRSILVH